MAVGELVEGVEAVGEFGGGEEVGAEEGAEVVGGGAVALGHIAGGAAGDEVAVGVEEVVGGVGG